MKQEPHFGKPLGEISGIDLDELNSHVKQSVAEEIEERAHFKLNDNLFYIKNHYEYFKDTPVHYLADTPVKHGSLNLEIATYQTLNNLKSYPDLDMVILELEDYFEFDEEIKEFLFKNNLVESYEYGDGFWDYVYEINSTEELKSYLDSENIDSTGDKRDMVSRIRKLNLYEDFSVFDFKLTKKGIRYLNSIGWIKHYLEFLDYFDFYEFEDYLDSQKGDFMNIAWDFLERHWSVAVDREDFIAAIDVQSAKSLYHIVTGNWRDALDEELKLFIVRLNPICSDDDGLVFHAPIDYVNIHNLTNLLALCKMEDVEHLFKRNWEALDFKKPWISKEKSFEYFTKALTSSNPDELNSSAEEYYFKE